MKPRVWKLRLECMQEGGVCFYSERTVTEEQIKDMAENEIDLLHNQLSVLEFKIRQAVKATPPLQEAP